MQSERVRVMSGMEIIGGRRLCGEITPHGAKNSALPLLAATLLPKGESVIHNCPRLSDVDAAVEIMKYLGCRVSVEGDVVTADATQMTRYDIPERLMREMRSSISFLGAILTKTGRAELSMPGGCELGARPIDLHLSALRRMGAVIDEKHGFIRCRCDGRLKGTAITLSFPSVGATENIMIAAALAQGTTVITNAAREPEISDLADYLNKCGARISGFGSGTITIEGVETLSATEHRVIPDRIEAATYMAAAAITGGKLVLKGTENEHLRSVLSAFEESGCQIRQKRNMLVLEAPRRLEPVRFIRTMPYPGFPTDAQAIIMAMTTVARGSSVFVETIFDNRFKHTWELMRLGARIKTEGRVAVVEGVDRLFGAQVESTDLRGAAALIIAALAAEGKTTVGALRHLDRGYEKFEEGLCSLGACVRRI